MDKRITCSDCPLCNVAVGTLCEDYCSDMADFIEEIRADVIDECIALYKEYQPRLATHVSEFGDALEQLKEQKNEYEI